MPTNRYHHGDLRHSLIEAALRIIDEEGVGALTIRRVAHAVGVSHAAPAHHFGDKAGIILAVATEGFRIFGRRIQEAMTADDPTERLRQMGRAYCRFAYDHPSYYFLMFGPSEALPAYYDETFVQASIATFEALMDAVRPLVTNEHDSAEEADRRTGAAAMSAWSQVHGVVMLWSCSLFNYRTERTWDGDLDMLVENAVRYSSQTMPYFAKHDVPDLWTPMTAAWPALKR